MSGVEVFGVISGATALLEVCLKLGTHLARFVQRASGADTFATDLSSKVGQLRTCAITVQRAARSRERQAGPGEQDRDEIEIWKTIERTLSHCERLFNRFEALLKSMAPGKEDLNWLEKALLQTKIDIREPKILELEKKIDFHLTTLNTTILSVHLYGSISPSFIGPKALTYLQLVSFI